MRFGVKVGHVFVITIWCLPLPSLLPIVYHHHWSDGSFGF